MFFHAINAYYLFKMFFVFFLHIFQLKKQVLGQWAKVGNIIIIWCKMNEKKLKWTIAP